MIASSLPQGGFTRFSVGRSVLLVDSGAPPKVGFDKRAHAGTLSFEFSHHQQRLFVNCGTVAGGEWKTMLRDSAAHSLMVVENASSSEFSSYGHITRGPSRVGCEEHISGEKYQVTLSHDGYYASHGVMWTRILTLNKGGCELTGCDVVEGERDVECVLRFHIHPTVRAFQDDDDIILYTEDIIWRFCQRGGDLSLEEDVYLGRGLPEKTKQICVRHIVGFSIEDQNKNIKRQQKVEWTLEQVPH